MSDSKELKKIVASRLREARTIAGLSQGQVARILGMHRPTISEIEAGNRNVSTTELARFAEIYDVSLSWLAGQGVEKLDPHDDRVQLAFRELKKLKPNDLDKLLKVLAALQGSEDKE